MGNTCTHATDAIVHLVTEDEIQQAVKSIEEWQKAQAVAIKNGGQGQQGNYGPLLARVGGPDVVRKVVELFYKKLYSDPRLVPFLYDQDVMHLRAKQSAFISWLFGPPNVPYNGRSVRIAHLRIIKQRNFSPNEYDMGMKYFEDAMAELGAPESIIGEVMRRLKPFKDAFFTPSSKDPEEEARWAAEDRAREVAALEQKEREAREKEEERQLREQEKLLEALEEEADSESSVSETDAPPTAPEDVDRELLGEEVPAAVAEAVAEAVADSAGTAGTAAGEANGAVAVVATGAGGGGGGAAGGSRPGSRLGPQCPFSGGRISRPTSSSSKAAAAVVAPGAGVKAAAADPMAAFEAELKEIERSYSPVPTSAVQVSVDV